MSAPIAPKFDDYFREEDYLKGNEFLMTRRKHLLFW